MSSDLHICATNPTHKTDKWSIVDLKRSLSSTSSHPAGVSLLLTLPWPGRSYFLSTKNRTSPPPHTHAQYHLFRWCTLALLGTRQKKPLEHLSSIHTGLLIWKEGLGLVDRRRKRGIQSEGRIESSRCMGPGGNRVGSGQKTQSKNILWEGRPSRTGVPGGVPPSRPSRPQMCND